MRINVRLTTILLVIAIPVFLAFHDDPGNGPKTIGNSAAAGSGGAGPWPCENMELMGHLTLSEIGGGAGNVLGNDCWGWTDSLNGNEYAIAGLTNGTSFIDISDPFNPQYLGTLPTQTGNASWRDMKVFNDHCFIVSDGNGDHGMQVFDLTQLRTVNPNNPQTFSNTAWYDGISFAHNIAINEDTGYAYVIGSSQASGGLHVVDISNPTNPVAAGNFSADGYTHDAQIVVYSGPDSDYTGREIAFASNEDTLTIVDVTNKNNMTQISRNGYPGEAYTHQSWMTEDQRYCYLCDELDESGTGGTITHVWDCLDLDNPIYLGTYRGTTEAIDHNLYIKDGFIYLASYSAGLRVLEFDPANPLAPTEVAFFDSFPTDNDTDFDGCWSCFPFFDSGVVFINDRQNGLFIVRLSPIEFDIPGGTPDMLSPTGGVVEFEVNVTGFASTPQPGTGQLHVDRGNGYEVFPMNEVAPNTYQAVFPTTDCGDLIPYFVSAEDVNGSRIAFPFTAPDFFFESISGDTVSTIFEDDFETDQGWTVSGDATDGIWERGLPSGDGTRGDPSIDGDGSGACFLTGNAAGNTDIDGGTTVLTSPSFDASAAAGSTGTFSYYRWYSNDLGNAPASDIFVVEISNDDGASWTNVETVGPGGNEVSGTWFFKQFEIGAIITPTDQMRVRFIASDLGDGSVVEAAIDGIDFGSVSCAETITANVESFDITVGGTFGGNLASLQASDNNDIRLNKNPGQITNRLEVEFLSTSHSATPTEMSLTIEAAVLSRGTIAQSIEMYNYDTDSWETVDTRNASRTGDVTITIDGAGDLSRYVQPGTLTVESRIRFDAPNARAAVAGFVDHVFWTITN